MLKVLGGTLIDEAQMDCPSAGPSTPAIEAVFWEYLILIPTLMGVVLGTRATWWAQNDHSNPATFGQSAFFSSVCRDNIDRFKRRFEKIEQAAQGSQYSVMRPHCGYHALALTKSCTLEESDPMGWSRSLLPLGVYALPGHDFGYAPDDYFCFRISLSIEQDAEKLRSVFNAPVQRGN